MRYQILMVNAVTGIGTDFFTAANKLSEMVTKAMSDGWRPIGGVAVGETQSLKEPHLFQAIVHD